MPVLMIMSGYIKSIKKSGFFIFTGSISWPVPVTIAGELNKKTGTSLPTFEAISTILSNDSPRFRCLFKNSRNPAPLVLPPPNPAPTGMVFSITTLNPGSERFKNLSTSLNILQIILLSEGIISFTPFVST
ncbi:MAG TPA: hypothetical protein PKG52_02865 [bacterium]|nr:hypothetical protein [bacterium]HPS30732.1 hypothetical protein [bacterium]